MQTSTNGLPQIENVLLFKAENKILLHNGGICFYLLQPDVIFKSPNVSSFILSFSNVSYYPMHRLSKICSNGMLVNAVL